MAKHDQPSDRLVVATMWSGPVSWRIYPEERDPTPEELDQFVADQHLVENNGGVRPTVRVIRRSRWVPPPEEAA